jgi:hypothetical protein
MDFEIQRKGSEVEGESEGEGENWETGECRVGILFFFFLLPSSFFLLPSKAYP